MRNVLVLILAIAVMTSCCTEEEMTDDYFVFGAAAGECSGDCSDIYKIEDGKLYMDIEGNYIGSLDFTEVSAEKYAIALPLTQQIPDELYNNTETAYGCPDCYDQGLYYLEIKDEDESIKKITIDPTIADIPEYLHDFVEELQEVLTELK